MDFIRSMISRDLQTGKYHGRVVTRFPPEPNGYLHIGHAKSLCLNFGIAAEHPGGRCHLRLDDTNPDTEKAEFVEAMKRDIRWLGFDWGEHLYHASDYFGQLYRYALTLIDKGLAYVDSSTEAEIRERRGSVTRPGVNSPWRDRSRTENLDLFRRMRAGEFADGSHVLRARIDMAHRNMVMRDPILYRIRHASHYRHGDEWPIYPMYDFAHCLSDSIERVTHSLCTLEFENNRAIYDWLLEHVDAPQPRPEQTEFAPLILDYVVTSKSKLRPLVEGRHVDGWDDPRMPTLAGLRRRGVTPAAIRAMCDMVGVARAQSRVDLAKLEFAVRDDLNAKAPRAFCVLDPLRVVLTNYPHGKCETFTAPSFPGKDGHGKVRKLAFGRVILVDRSDFEETPPPGFHRLTPGGEVRLKYAYVIRCIEVVRDSAGQAIELRCTVDRSTAGGASPRGRRVKGTIQWVEPGSAVKAEVRLYDRLFAVPEPPLDDLVGALNPRSQRLVKEAMVEPSVSGTIPEAHLQFERLGYFVADKEDSRDDRLVFNRTVTLRDGWKDGFQAEAPASTQAKGSVDAESGAAVRAKAPGSPTPQTRLEDALRTDEARASFREMVAAGAAETTALSLARAPELRRLFAASRADYPDGSGSIAAWIANDVARAVRTDSRVDLAQLGPRALADLVRAVDEDSLSHRQGRRVLEGLLLGGGTFDEARRALDLEEIGDEGALRAILDALIARYPDKAEAYRNGQLGLLGFFVGSVMKQTGGKADPRKASALAKRMLSASCAGTPPRAPDPPPAARG